MNKVYLIHIIRKTKFSPLISVPRVQNLADEGIQANENICESTLFSATGKNDPSAVPNPILISI